MKHLSRHAKLLTVAAMGVATTMLNPSIAKAGTFSSTPNPVWFGYTCVTNNDPTNCQTGQNQLKTKVSQYQATATSPVQVLFEFFNKGPLASSITQVYFDDTSPLSLLGVASVINSSGVSFSQSSPGPNNLPGGRTIAFSADYMAGATAPVQPNGVNPGETLGILFNLQSGFTDPFNAVISDLQSGSLRVGLHVQGFSNGGSESFVNEAVPEPLTLLGSGAALGFGLVLKRKKAAPLEKSNA